MQTPPDTAPEGTPVIEMRGVNIGSLMNPKVTMLEGVDWTVQAGEFWVIAGMQGSGKSDLLSTAAGLISPQGGEYRLFGNEMPIFEGPLLKERLRIGLVFDGGQLFHHLTVGENVALPYRYHKGLSIQEAEPRLREVLKLTGLEDWAGSTPGAIGRNLKKRTGLARALILEPEVLLLDNPLGGLDLRQTSWWLGLMDQLAKGHEFLKGRPTTLVVTTDDLRHWRGRPKQFAILQEKRFVALGNKPEEAMAAHPIVKELLAEELPDI
ncbi:ATP-binding cassette domain-containing protein [Pedosphaera parvula]|uniref:ABC transporter related-protein n=1 Tax=Pedosphaera parvula (strain Ellin514) TaxID=320771 RepID=B9XHU4_PEDPL|nr:ATP-binding cassette domain-containing protein [Pedosphaera parvula]EEF60672.1 ABC transporter related-protein [Pedosphaera parvula Ellin514]